MLMQQKNRLESNCAPISDVVYFLQIVIFVVVQPGKFCMSRSTNCTLTCPCGEVFTSTIYEYVNVAQEPQLQYTVLAGLLNVSTCPVCGRKAAISRPFIYSDPAHHLLAYVHPRSDVPEEARLLILEKLRDVYVNIVGDVEPSSTSAESNGSASSHEPTAALPLAQQAEVPPLQVIFGLDQLNEVINAMLSQDERLGKLALSTHSREEAERGRLLDIARRLAREMQCQVEVEELSDEYTVWLYGSRRQIGALMRELAPRG
jgi:CpXC protein